MQSVASTCLRNIWLPVLALAVSMLSPDIYAAAAMESAAPRFTIQRFEVDGNTLLKPAEIDAAVAGFAGAQKDFSDIQRALEVLVLVDDDLRQTDFPP